MKCKSVLGALTVALSMTMVTNASAFGLPKIGGSALGLPETGSSDKPAVSGSPETMDSVLTQQDSLVKTYQSSLRDILSSQALLLEAYGMKEEAAKLRSEAEALAKGPLDKEQFSIITRMSERIDRRINALIDKQKALTDEGRKKYLQALLPYATGVAQMAKLAPELKSFLKSASGQLKSASLMEKAKVMEKLDVGMYLAKASPGYLSNVASTTKKVVTYAKKQGVSKKTADDALKMLSRL